MLRHAKYVTFQMAKVAVPRELFAAILERIQRFSIPPRCYNEPEPIGAFGAVGGGYNQWIAHASYYRTEQQRSAGRKKMLQLMWHSAEGRVHWCLVRPMGSERLRSV